jgi:class 3 adenylate cyclase/predicted Ser/Thr protein kinase
LSENVVAALVSGSLPPAELEAAERHLDGCASCRELVARTLHDLVPAPPAHGGGARIGRYRVLREVGAGSMGRVYAAEDPDLGREVALKVLRSPEGADREGRRARLLREARAMARLAHPNVITVYEVAEADEQIFIAMELVHGATLGRWLRDAPRGWRAVADVLCAAGRGLSAAHAAGIVHRDFKPDNVLVGDDGRVRVTDFGLAQVGAGEAPAASGVPAAPSGTPELALTALTASGALVGTPAYMAPEQLRGDPTDERSDLFSFCVAFWEALYGERPFAGRDLEELHTAVAAGAIRPPPEGRAVPRSLQDALRRGLQPARGDRPASMAALLAAIDAAVAPGAVRTAGELRELTVYFFDLGKFDTLAEALPPDELVETLGLYLDEMSRIITAERGTVDKYLGDGIIAFWGAPVPLADHAARACAAALRCHARVRELASEVTPMAARIGLATGDVIVGNVGATELGSYTVMGGTVNFASQLERLNQRYGTALMIAEPTFVHAREAIVARPLDLIAAPGRPRGVRIYELLALAADRDASAEALAADATAALDAYLSRRFDEAIAAWDRVLARRPGDRAAERLRARAAELAASPPGPDWTGVSPMAP